MGRQLRQDEFPSSDDPIWSEITRPILRELKKPKTTAQLKDWARAEKLEVGRLINALAWLDMRGVIEAQHDGGKATWKRVRRKTPVLRPAPTCCPRCGGSMKNEPDRFACIQCGHSIYAPPEYDG